MKKKLLLLTAIATMQFSNAQIIHTTAGTGIVGYSGDGGQATSAELSSPYGVSVDNLLNVYIADYYNQRIRIINSSGIISTIAGTGAGGYSGDGGPATAAELYQPSDVSWATGTGNLYISDEDNNRIRMVNTSGIITTIAGNGILGYSGDGGPATAAEMHYPYGVAVDRAGNIYVAEFGGERVRKIDTAGIITTYAGTGTAGYSGDGGQATAAEINAPLKVALDTAGNLYIADAYNNRIRKVSPSGIISTFAGRGVGGYSGDGGPATAADLYWTFGVACDGNNVYISDLNNNRTRMVNTSGVINTIAGNGISGYSGDGGPATAAELHGPVAVATAPGGVIYIADQQNQRIRMVAGIPLDVNAIHSGNSSVLLYPNPNNGQFSVIIASEAKQSQPVIEIYNMLGEKIYSAKLTSANCQVSIDKPSGIYFYKIVSERGDMLSEGKFIVEK